MEQTIQNSLLIALIVCTGLSAGLCFTWSNAVTTGLGRLDNFGYLSAFQQMNRTILNPLFFLVFFGPLILGVINMFVFKSATTTVVWLLILAVVIYFIGVLLVTVFGNVPLNEILDQTNLNTASLEDLKTLRNQFEAKWNRLHLIRTVASIVSFILLLIALTELKK